MRAEVERWNNVIKAANVKLDSMTRKQRSRARRATAHERSHDANAGRVGRPHPRFPYWIYSDRDLYAEEQARIFRGDDLDVPLPGGRVADVPIRAIRVSNLGDMSVVVTRDKDGAIHAFENRCAHRGSLLCLKERGEAREIVCVYHNWTYDLEGKLTGVAFRRGVGGKGGMPADSRPDEHAPRPAARRDFRRLGVRHDVGAQHAVPIEEYLGVEIAAKIRRVMKASPVRLLGSYSQILPGNWKLYMENVKDSYHASLLHMFFTTFRLNRLSQKGGLVVSESGGNHISYSMSADVAGKEYEQAGMRSANSGYGQLEAPELLDTASMSSATASACKYCRCSRASCCSRPATVWRCAGWCRKAWRRPSWYGLALALPPTMRR